MPRLPHVFGLIAAVAIAAVNGCSHPSPPARQSDSVERPAASPIGSNPMASLDGSARAVGVPVQGHDAYVLLSGGGTPLSNNYSQYLQAKAVVDFFERECPTEKTWVFFGAGNRDGAPALLSDARREVKHEGLLIQTWLPGTLKRNQPATRESFLRALREEILPTVREGGTLYLFVGDHGELVGTGDKRESAITLWQMKRGRRRSTGWYTDEKEVLGVAELRKILTDGLGRGRVVFCMTQCHAGGFHELAVKREMTPPRDWFTSVPPWAAGRPGGIRLPVAGFTATDETSVAAGCDADPDPERWAGYERFLPESLFGIDLMTGQSKGQGTRSFAEAHVAATLVDQTIDKPRATSEHFLEAWARLVETRLATELRLSSRTREAVAAFQRAVDRSEIADGKGELQRRKEQFASFTRQLTEQLPAAKTLLMAGTRQQLESAVPARSERGGGRGNRRGAMTELRRAWTDTLRPAWKSAVMAGTVPGLHGAALDFEKQLLKLEDDGSNFLLPRGGDDTPLANEIYWSAGYGEPAKLDEAKATAVARWGAERRARIVLWSKTSGDPNVQAAAEKIGPGPMLVDEPPRSLSRQTAVERVLFYRRVLAAWQFLVTMDAKASLAELQQLIDLERTPLRRSL